MFDAWTDWLVDNEEMYAPSSSFGVLTEQGGALGIIPAEEEKRSCVTYLDAIDVQLPTLAGLLLESGGEKVHHDEDATRLSNSDLQISTADVLEDVGTTPSILLFPSDTREDPVVPSQPDPQCLAPEYRTLKAESDSDDDEVPYSPLTTYHDPTPLSSPQARSTHLLRAELRASARSKSSAASDDYAIDDDDHTIESDSGSDYEPETRATAHRRRRAGPATRPKKSHTRSRARARSFNSADTPSLTPSPLSVASSIPSSPGTNPSSLRAGRLRSLQVTSTSVPFSRRCSICRYEPPRNCKAEMARHMNTHTYEQRTRMHGHDWFCCGVPVARAEEFNITDVSDARTWEDMNSLMGNRLMVGGCGQSFVRRDSYGRHLNGKRCVCVGDSKADWVPGNMRPRSGSFSSSE